VVAGRRPGRVGIERRAAGNVSDAAGPAVVVVVVVVVAVVVVDAAVVDASAASAASAAPAAVNTIAAARTHQPFFLFALIRRGSSLAALRCTSGARLDEVTARPSGARRRRRREACAEGLRGLRGAASGHLSGALAVRPRAG
jgi:hypothetical protein